LGSLPPSISELEILALCGWSSLRAPSEAGAFVGCGLSLSLGTAVSLSLFEVRPEADILLILE
jgi:hypothetical protein